MGSCPRLALRAGACPRERRAYVVPQLGRTPGGGELRRSLGHRAGGRAADRARGARLASDGRVLRRGARRAQRSRPARGARLARPHRHGARPSRTRERGRRLHRATREGVARGGPDDRPRRRAQSAAGSAHPRSGALRDRRARRRRPRRIHSRLRGCTGHHGGSRHGCRHFLPSFSPAGAAGGHGTRRGPRRRHTGRTLGTRARSERGDWVRLHAVGLGGRAPRHDADPLRDSGRWNSTEGSGRRRLSQQAPARRRDSHRGSADWGSVRCGIEAARSPCSCARRPRWAS